MFLRAWRPGAASGRNRRCHEFNIQSHHHHHRRRHLSPSAPGSLTCMPQTSTPCILPSSSKRSDPVACERFEGTSPLFDPSPWMIGGPWPSRRRTEEEKARREDCVTELAAGRKAGVTADRRAADERRRNIVMVVVVVVVVREVVRRERKSR